MTQDLQAEQETTAEALIAKVHGGHKSAHPNTADWLSQLVGDTARSSLLPRVL